MQGAWGWGTSKPHSTETPNRPWQGQWESHGYGDMSGWESGTWDQLSKGDSSHYEDFENVMCWDDSGAREAFETAKKIQEGSLKGSASSLSLPSPDLYIQVIDWDSREDLKLPDSAETSQQGERIGQRKRGRKGGAFRRQFDRQDFAIVADQKQNGQSFSGPLRFNEAKPKGDHPPHHGLSNGPVQDDRLNAHQTERVPCHTQSSVQDRIRGNWSAQWKSHSYQRQNFSSGTRQDHGRSNWDEGHNSQTIQSRYRWPQTNVSFEPVRGWSRGADPPHSSHGLVNDPRSQSTPAAYRNEQSFQGKPNGRGLQQQSIAQFNRGSKEQHQGPSHLIEDSRRWRRQQQQQQQQQPPAYHPWQ